jgi:hypothetical protein
VDIGVAVLALDVIEEVGAGIVLRGFFLVATMTGERLNLGPGSLGQDVLRDIRNI